MNVKKEEIKRFFIHCPVQNRTKATMMVNRERRKEIEAGGREEKQTSGVLLGTLCIQCELIFKTPYTSD
jgi:hypothetical protein